MSTLPPGCSNGGAKATQTGCEPRSEPGTLRNRVPQRVRANITWSAVPTAKIQNTQVIAVTSPSRVASRCSLLRGLEGLRVGADIRASHIDYRYYRES